jgi:hypothetical protein
MDQNIRAEVEVYCERPSTPHHSSPSDTLSLEGEAKDHSAPTIAEITQLTRQELTTASKTDPIRECGRAAIAILPSDPNTCQELAYQKLHDVPYKDVKACWRRLYTDATLWRVVERVDALQTNGQDEEKGSGWIDEVVKLLDMALILTGAPTREEVVELWFSALKAVLSPDCDAKLQELDIPERPTKRRKLARDDASMAIPSSFPTAIPTNIPALRHTISRIQELSMSAFQTKISDISKHTPMIIEGALQHWPALHERPWSDPGYLLEQTLGGRRLVPVEIGKSYTAEGWGQKIISFKEFMQTYMIETAPELQNNGNLRKKGYLAQHDLFAQVPSLRADISIPDYCYCTPAPSPHLKHIKPTPNLEEPLLNAWFGPAGTVSPLHTDPYHNILAQVVGYKYVRLYAPEHSDKLYPRSVDENGVDMSNTSQVDLDEAVRVFGKTSCWKDEDGFEKELVEEAKQDFEEQFPLFRDAPYVEAILSPGECLYLPVGWWHYIRSLTTSFSVSFWFN